ncbi:hypothetical protein Csa_021386 [Cucumis sativus]|nr:hypothetical protein Csa_021386 [Cucumis sativus]
MSSENKGSPIFVIDQREDVQQIGQNATHIHNQEKPDTLGFLRVTYGLEDVNATCKSYTLGVEALNKDKIIWTYMASIKMTEPHDKYEQSFKDPFGYYT